jgi:hypothetical protein
MRRVIILLIIITVFSPPTQSLNGEANLPNRVADDRQTDWNEIMSLYKAGKNVLIKLRKSSDSGLEAEKIRIFNLAAQKLEHWINMYEPDTGSLVYLRSTYRLGNYLEYACKYSKAVEVYHECKSHPLLGCVDVKKLNCSTR